MPGPATIVSRVLQEDVAVAGNHLCRGRAFVANSLRIHRQEPRAIGATQENRRETDAIGLP